MKLIHLSDLHIGKRVHEISMLEDQAYILKQILQIIDEEQPDAVMICGDVYDKSVPSAEAVTLFDDFLVRLAKRKLPVMIISGNHDSPERLAFGNRLIESAGIHIAPVYDGTVKPITLNDTYGQVHFWLLPFLKPAHVKRYYENAGIESYTDAIRVAIEKMALDTNVRNVLLTHQFVAGAATCDSEEISVGGTDNVDAGVFADFDYVALGHLHGQQNIGSDSRIRYCGTPLKYSISEKDHHKSVTVVELQEKGKRSLQLRPLQPMHDLRSIRGSFQKLTDKVFYSAIATDDYLEVVLTDEEDVPEAIGKLRTIYPNIMHLRYDNTRTRTNHSLIGASEVEQKTPLQLFEELYELQNNQPMSQQQREFTEELIRSIQEETV